MLNRGLYRLAAPRKVVIRGLIKRCQDLLLICRCCLAVYFLKGRCCLNSTVILNLIQDLTPYLLFAVAV